MAEAGRYRRTFPRMWRHPGFRRLKPAHQLFALYCLNGPQSNRIGLYLLSLNTAAEDLEMTPASLRRALIELSVSFNWLYDSNARVLYIPSWWRWNPPDHAKVLQGNLKDLSDLPPCTYTDAFARNLEFIKPELHETFAEACRIRLPRASRSQEQEHFQNHEQEQGQEAAGAAESGQEGLLLTIARTIVRDLGPVTTEALIDHVQHDARNTRLGSVKRSEALSAINQALSELRASA